MIWEQLCGKLRRPGFGLYTPSCVFNEYGDGVNRAARGIFHEERILCTYETQAAPPINLVGGSLPVPFGVSRTATSLRRKRRLWQNKKYVLFTGLAIAGSAGGEERI